MGGRWFGRGCRVALGIVTGRFVTVSMVSSFNVTWLSSSQGETGRSWSLGWLEGYGRNSDSSLSLNLLPLIFFYSLVRLSHFSLAISSLFCLCIFWNLGSKLSLLLERTLILELKYLCTHAWREREGYPTCDLKLSSTTTNFTLTRSYRIERVIACMDIPLVSKFWMKKETECLFSRGWK